MRVQRNAFRCRFTVKILIVKGFTGQKSKLHFIVKRIHTRGSRKGRFTMAQEPEAQVPLDAEWDWQEAAACADRGVHMFFHPVNARGQSRRQRELTAQAICFGCSVRNECADYAIRSREPYGVWGGLTEFERQSLFDVLLPGEVNRQEVGAGLRALARLENSIDDRESLSA